MVVQPPVPGNGQNPQRNTQKQQRQQTRDHTGQGAFEHIDRHKPPHAKGQRRHQPCHPEHAKPCRFFCPVWGVAQDIAEEYLPQDKNNHDSKRNHRDYLADGKNGGVQPFERPQKT